MLSVTKRTMERLLVAFLRRYGEGSVASGVFYEDIFSLTDASIFANKHTNSVQFGCLREKTGLLRSDKCMDGILGLPEGVASPMIGKVASFSLCFGF